ncbi:MAG: cation:proton antiporter [Gammaproteobacteria bacterium]|nr:cation:proton antiporter [Gammaproteobacteria bacterium]MBV9620261.1 cation:proton antiporter [Gammaproteobacteria bacterium]
MTHAASVALFLEQILVLLVIGRAAGELLQRCGQPPVIGQILAGVVLGPSVFGALAPGVYGELFPRLPAQAAMLDAVSQLGILLLLLLTGMETDLSVFRRARRAALSISVSGILLPLGCGVALGYALPASLLPAPGTRLITALFLGTALAISSVKIVALVVRDLGFLRRTVGQVIIGAAILDDAIGWIIMSVIFGLALHGRVDLLALARSSVGTLLFLLLAFTVGRRLVFRIIRWSNDTLTSELASVSTILAIMGVAALITESIGVHFVLGAFIAGVLIGQSPILTRQLRAQVRGLIIALFMPVFFATAGLATDVRALGQPTLLLSTAGLILVASVGKFLGAFVGGRIGGLAYAECLAVGCGMNARGSTEIIVASVGLSIGALNRPLFSAIVAMAVVTTMVMPPTLRWALRRLPLGEEERARLEREEFEAESFLKRVERLLVAADETPSGQLALHFAGLLAGVRRITTTVLHLAEAPLGEPAAAVQPAARLVQRAVRAGDRASTGESEAVDIVTRAEPVAASAELIAAEARKGYGWLLLGREPVVHEGRLDAQIRRSALEFGGAFGIVIARGAQRARARAAVRRVLVPVRGTRFSREGAEVAVALAQALGARVTALYVAPAPRGRLPWRQRFGRAIAPTHTASAALREIVEMGEHYGIRVERRIRNEPAPEAIVREAQEGYELLVMGVSPRPGADLFFGEVTAHTLSQATCSLVLVSSEPVREPQPAEELAGG